VHGSDYAVISRRVKQAGLLDRRRGYYWAKIPLTLAGYVAGWVLFVVIGDSWYQAITAVVLGVVFTQVAFSATTRDIGRCLPAAAGTTCSAWWWATCCSA